MTNRKQSSNLMLSIQPKKRILTQKYQTLNLNILPRLIIINLLVKHVMKQKKSFDKFAFAVFINNTDFDKKVATLATKAELIAEQSKLVKI